VAPLPPDTQGGGIAVTVYLEAVQTILSMIDNPQREGLEETPRRYQALGRGIVSRPPGRRCGALVSGALLLIHGTSSRESHTYV